MRFSRSWSNCSSERWRPIRPRNVNGCNTSGGDPRAREAVMKPIADMTQAELGACIQTQLYAKEIEVVLSGGAEPSSRLFVKPMCRQAYRRSWNCIYTSGSWGAHGYNRTKPHAASNLLCWNAPRSPVWWRNLRSAIGVYRR